MSKHPAVLQIIENVPAEVICARLNVKDRSIRLARERGVFPSSWFPIMAKICAEHGQECPLEAFNWKSPSSSDASLSEAS